MLTASPTRAWFLHKIQETPFPQLRPVYCDFFQSVHAVVSFKIQLAADVIQLTVEVIQLAKVLAQLAVKVAQLAVVLVQLAMVVTWLAVAVVHPGMVAQLPAVIAQTDVDAAQLAVRPVLIQMPVIVKHPGNLGLQIGDQGLVQHHQPGAV